MVQCSSGVEVHLFDIGIRFNPSQSITPWLTALDRYGRILFEPRISPLGRTLLRSFQTTPLRLVDNVAHAHPSGKSGNSVRSGAAGSLYLPLRLVLGLPAGAAFGQDALQQDTGGLVLPSLGPGQLRLGGDQASLAGGLEDAGPVAFQVGLRPPQRFGHR